MFTTYLILGSRVLSETFCGSCAYASPEGNDDFLIFVPSLNDIIDNWFLFLLKMKFKSSTRSTVQSDTK